MTAPATTTTSADSAGAPALEQPRATRSPRRGIANETWEPSSFEWYTPAWVFERLGLVFDLDVASPGLEHTPWIPARACFTRHDDGLAQPWVGRVWVNPPYGDQVPRFIGRLADHGDGIALVLSRTDTRWFHTALSRATVTCFVAGRLNHVPGSAQAVSRPAVGSVLFAFGDVCARALRDADLGSCVVSSAGAPAQRTLELEDVEQ